MIKGVSTEAHFYQRKEKKTNPDEKPQDNYVKLKKKTAPKNN